MSKIVFNPLAGKFDYMQADDAYDSRFFIVDTKATILASTPANAKIGFATDTDEFYLYDTNDSEWKVASLKLKAEDQNPDMGAYDAGGLGESDKQGYYEDAITDKRLSNVLIGGNARTESGGIRIDVTQDPDTFEIYLRDAWQTIIYDLTTEDGDFRHAPVSESIYVWRGDSVSVGLNNQPVVQEYSADMGAYPSYKILNGGTF